MFKINEQFKVVCKGTSLKAEEDGDFLLHDKLQKATLQEVAKANNVEVPRKASAPDLFKAIEKSFNEREDIPTMNDQTENKAEGAGKPKAKIDQKYIDIVKKGFEANKDADAIQVDLVKAGLKFKQAASMFKKIAEQEGFKISAKERNEKAKELLGDFVPKSWEDVEKSVKHLTENIKDTSEPQALAVLRKICKDAEVEFPKKPKGAKGGGGPRGFKAEVYKWMLENPKATKKELEKFLTENGQRPVYIPHYWDIMEFARKFSEVYNKQ